MGGILGGGSKAKSSSSNRAWDLISSGLGGALNYTTGAGDLLSALLGVGGNSQGFDNFANSAGMNEVLDAGSRAITGNTAARGLFRSGATGKALTKFGQDTAKSYLKDYVNSLGMLGNLGLGAGQLLVGAGQQSKSSQGGGKGGLGGFLGGLASGVAGGL